MKLNISSRRAGFTLIEMLIVIAIIAILASLLLGAIFYINSKTNEVGAANDISQLSAALQSFKGQYKIYPPDFFHICSNRSDYNTANPVDVASLAVIDRMWPNIGNFTNQNWDGTGSLKVNEFLDGDQSMVFFLGGIRPPGGFTFTGFSVDPKNPGQLPGGNIGRVNAFYNFPSDRMFLKLNLNAKPVPKVTTNFPSYSDFYNNTNPPTPYLYFSSNNRKNGYTVGYTITLQDKTIQVNPAATVTVQAYWVTAGPPVAANGLWQFNAPDTFQIICAGRDGCFNNGGVAGYQWTPVNVTTVQNGKDDRTNFTDNLLGVAQ